MSGPVTGAVTIDQQTVKPGHLAYLGAARDKITLSATDPTRVLLFGGVPFDEPILMWWNYVARDRAEILQAHTDWMAASERYGRVNSTLPRIEVGPPPWTR